VDTACPVSPYLSAVAAADVGFGDAALVVGFVVGVVTGTGGEVTGTGPPGRVLSPPPAGVAAVAVGRVGRVRGVWDGVACVVADGLADVPLAEKAGGTAPWPLSGDDDGPASDGEEFAAACAFDGEPEPPVKAAVRATPAPMAATKPAVISAPFGVLIPPLCRGLASRTATIGIVVVRSLAGLRTGRAGTGRRSPGSPESPSIRASRARRDSANRARSPLG
jgi:hypothetical protein